MVALCSPLTLPRPFWQVFAGKLTLVTVSFQAFGKLQSDAWHAPFMEAFGIGTLTPTRGVQVP